MPKELLVSTLDQLHSRTKLTRMEYEHAAHGTPVVVENPLLLFIDDPGMRLPQLIHDEPNNGLSIVPVRSDASFRKIVEMVRVENVESV